MNTAFTRELERLVVAQVCTSFETVDSPAVDVLAELLSRFLQQLSQVSHMNMDLAGRCGLNIGDVLGALGDVDFCFSRVLRNASAFEIPFAHTLPPRLHLRRLPKRAPAYRELCSNMKRHIPAFLPAPPDSHTFKLSGEVKSTYQTAQCEQQARCAFKGDSSCSLRGDCRVGGYGAYEDLSPRNHGLLRALACHTDPEVRFASVRESASSLQLTAFHQGKEIYSSLHSLPFSSELKWNGGKEIDSSMVSTMLFTQ
jgi:hypothetical protein